MTFAEIRTEVMARTRQTSTEASDRILRAILDRYRRVTTSIGLATSRRSTAQFTIPAGEEGFTFPCEKVLAVWVRHGEEGNFVRRMLTERTFDEYRNAIIAAPLVGIPYLFAVSKMEAGEVTLVFYPVPGADQIVAIDALVALDPLDLAPTETPKMPTDFHDILMHGALADEWLQLKQDALSARTEGMYEARLSDLRMFIAKSAYLDIHQGQRAGMNRGAYWPGYFLPRWP